MRLIFAGEPLHYSGKVFNLQRGFRLRFQPVRSSIPIFIASLTPRSVAQTDLHDRWRCRAQEGGDRAESPAQRVQDQLYRDNYGKMVDAPKEGLDTLLREILRRSWGRVTRDVFRTVVRKDREHDRGVDMAGSQAHLRTVEQERQEQEGHRRLPQRLARRRAA